MKFYSSEKKQRLTLSQAMVKFLQAQYSEYDGVEQIFSGNLGYFWAWECFGPEPGLGRIWR